MPSKELKQLDAKQYIGDNILQLILRWATTLCGTIGANLRQSEPLSQHPLICSG